MLQSPAGNRADPLLTHIPNVLTQVTLCERFAASFALFFRPMTLEDVLLEVWRQSLVENSKTVILGTGRFPVRTTPKSRLRQIDFVFDGMELRGLEQNPKTKSRWAQLARSGKSVMQFLSKGRYFANVVDGKLQLYGKFQTAGFKVPTG